MATIQFEDKQEKEVEEHILKSKFAVITIHDVSPENSDKIFYMTDELENLRIRYNFAMILCHNQNEQNDIRKNSELIKKIMNYKQPIALHGLYHEHNGDLEEFRDLNLEETRYEITKGRDIFKSRNSRNKN
jgi:predicted deacetylase